MKRLYRLAPLLALVLALGACGGDGDDTGGTTTPPPTTKADAEVKVTDPNNYDPKSVTITVGQTVRWTWTGSLEHTVTTDDGTLNSPTQRSGTYEKKFEKAGTVSYYCTVHGKQLQSGTVIVE